MEAAVLRGRDGEEQVGLAVVLGVVLDGLRQPQSGQAGPGDHAGLGVGHRDAVIDVGGTLGLAGVEGLFVGLGVGDIAVGGLQLHQLRDDLIPVGGGHIQCDGLGVEQFRNTHGVFSSYQSSLKSFSMSAFLASPRLNAVALPQAVPRRRAVL